MNNKNINYNLNSNNTATLIPDFDQAERFLTLLDEEAESFTFQTFADTPGAKSSPSSHAKILHGSLEEHWEELKRLNREGAGVFVTVQETDGTGRKKENITRIRAIFQEDDDGFGGEFPIEPHITVQSSPGKYHRYFLTDDAALDEFEAVQLRMVQDYGSDAAAKDRARVLRLPGFYHQKKTGEAHMVEIVDESLHQPIPWCELKQYFPTVQPQNHVSRSVGQQGTLDNVGHVASALEYLDPDMDYEEWLRVGMALHSTGAGQEAFELWDDWSKRGSKYQPGVTASKWQSFANGCANGVTLGSLFHMAQLAGWSPTPGSSQPTPAGGQGLITFDPTGNPDLTHDQLAIDLSRKYGWQDDASYVTDWSKWVFWNGNLWEVDKRLLHQAKVRAFLRDVTSEVDAWANAQAQNISSTDKAGKFVQHWRRQAAQLRQHGYCDKVARTAQSNPELAVNQELFDFDLMLVGTPDGTVDLRTGEHRHAQREDFITKKVAVAPAQEGTPAPRWEAFLEQTQDGDAEMVAFLKRLCGYTLTGLTTEHKLPFIFGSGGNGKSVFANTIHEVMGEYATSTSAETFLATRTTQHPTDLAKIKGKRLVTAAELPVGATWNESLLKDLTGGDTISARFMRQDSFEFSPVCTVFMIGNQQPALRTVDEAMRRRLLLIPFTRQISENDRDPQLPQKLKREWPAILRWMIEGAQEWQREGLNPPQRVLDASREYLDSEDTLGEFVADCLEAKQGGYVRSAELYQEFKRWCDARGMWPWTQQSLTKSLKTRSYHFSRDNKGNRLNGFIIKPDTPESEDPQPTAVSGHSRRIGGSDELAKAELMRRFYRQ